MESTEGRFVANFNRDAESHKLKIEQQIVASIEESLQNPEGLSRSSQIELEAHRRSALVSIGSLSNNIKRKKLVA